MLGFALKSLVNVHLDFPMRQSFLTISRLFSEVAF